MCCILYEVLSASTHAFKYLCLNVNVVVLHGWSRAAYLNTLDMFIVDKFYFFIQTVEVERIRCLCTSTFPEHTEDLKGSEPSGLCDLYGTNIHLINKHLEM